MRGLRTRAIPAGVATLRYNQLGLRRTILFLDNIEENFFELPNYIVADAGYGSEQNYKDANGQQLTYRYLSNRTDRNGFIRELKVYECEDCSRCPFRSQCTKAKEGHNRKIHYNEKWEQQKEYI